MKRTRMDVGASSGKRGFGSSGNGRASNEGLISRSNGGFLHIRLGLNWFQPGEKHSIFRVYHIFDKKKGILYLIY